MINVTVPTKRAANGKVFMVYFLSKKLRAAARDASDIHRGRADKSVR